MSKIDLDKVMTEFFENYFFFEEAAKLQEFVEDDDDTTFFITEEGYEELIELVDDLEEAVAKGLCAVRSVCALLPLKAC